MRALVSCLLLLAMPGDWAIGVPRDTSPPAESSVRLEADSRDGNLGDNSALHDEWYEPSEVTTAPAPKTRGLANAPLIPVLAADGIGGVHILTAPGFGSILMENAPEEISNWVMEANQWRKRTGPSSDKRIVYGMRAVTGKDGHIYLFWGDYGKERAASTTGNQIHLTSFDEVAWSDPETITDKGSEPLSFWGDLDAAVTDRRNIHVVWGEIGEDHLLESMFNGEGQYVKVIHRIMGDGAWTKPKKVQHWGLFDTGSPRIVASADVMHLFWSESRAVHGGRRSSNVLHSSYVDRQWSKPEEIAVNEYDKGFVQGVISVESTGGARGDIVVGWIATRWLNPAHRESKLAFRSLTQGRWSEATSVSDRCQAFRWVTGVSGPIGILIQEYPSYSFKLDERSGFPLYYLPMTPQGLGERQLLASDTEEDLFDAVVDAAGNQHIVFVRPGSDQRVHLLHRVLNTRVNDLMES